MSAHIESDVAAPFEISIANQLRGVNRLGVAFSGGVDSSVLLALAARILGHQNVIAVLGISPSLAALERTAAHKVAAFIGVEVLEVHTREGDRPEYQANGPDRCFHCKDELFSVITDELVDTNKFDAVAYGENADDAARIDRPGSRAATNHRVLRPLADAGMTKQAVRQIARELRLPSADKPAAPCLASRIPHHQVVTPAKLAQIEALEAALHGLGFNDLRVRHHDEIARIELPSDDLIRAVTPPSRDRIRAAARAVGFRYTVVDLAGMQSGAFTLSLIEAGNV